jgi:hypothetical protein
MRNEISATTAMGSGINRTESSIAGLFKQLDHISGLRRSTARRSARRSVREL